MYLHSNVYVIMSHGLSMELVMGIPDYGQDIFAVFTQSSTHGNWYPTKGSCAGLYLCMGKKMPSLDIGTHLTLTQEGCLSGLCPTLCIMR